MGQEPRRRGGWHRGRCRLLATCRRRSSQRLGQVQTFEHGSLRPQRAIMSRNVSFPSRDLEVRRLAQTYGWVLLLPVVAFACAVTAVYTLDNMSTSPLRWLPVTLWASAPALWIAVRVAPGPLRFNLVKMHAALYTGLVVVKFALVPYHHANGLVPLMRLMGWLADIAVLSGDAVFIAVASKRRRMSSSNRNGARFVYVGLTVFLLAGWYAGLLSWSSAFRPRLTAAAEAEALDQRYCIEVDGRPAQTADVLTGLGMRARNEGGWTYNFHAPCNRRWGRSNLPELVIPIRSV
jgi:hypothetical protein